MTNPACRNTVPHIWSPCGNVLTMSESSLKSEWWTAITAAPTTGTRQSRYTSRNASAQKTWKWYSSLPPDIVIMSAEYDMSAAATVAREKNVPRKRQVTKSVTPEINPPTTNA